MNTFVIIVAAGKGSRMESNIPKQFLLLAGRPVLMHTIERFFSWNSSVKIIVTLPDEQISYWNSLMEEHKFAIPHAVISGGSTRFHSVKNSLNSIASDKGIVAVHDGVRPLISTRLIEKLYREAQQKGNAVPSIPLNESVRVIEAESNRAIDRSKYKIIQTPQFFEMSVLKIAYMQEFQDFFTDDASVVELSAKKINLVEGEIQNLKITLPSDILLAEALINERKAL